MADVLLPGDPAPFFKAPVLDGNPRFTFDSIGGRHVLMLFHGSTRLPYAAEALALVARNRALFDDERALFFGVSIDREDAATGRIASRLPGIRWFLDHDETLFRLYGAALARDGETLYRPHWLLLDPTLRVIDRASIEDGARIVAALEAAIAAPAPHLPAPVLVVPRVLDPAICRRLIAGYDADGGEPSGFMREENGTTVLRQDADFKRRHDWLIDDEPLRQAAAARLIRFLLPMIERGLMFKATRVERWLVACYDDTGGGGHFRAHRDNTTKGTAHRRFAVTINLNAEDYEGGDLRFPEYGPATYRAPTGGAVVFSCGLLHEVVPVRRGRRYALLPFLYDEAGAKLREENAGFIEGAGSAYRAGLG